MVVKVKEEGKKIAARKKTEKSSKHKTHQNSYKVERVKTGIFGLDKLTQGGFVKGSSVLVSGETGTGKTIFCLQYLWEGLKNDESGVYITLEESAEEIKKDALVFGWDFEKYEKEGKFKIIEKNVFEDTNLEFFEIDELKAKRVVIDSVSLLSLFIEDKASMRNKMRELIKSLKERGVTVLLTSEIVGEGFSRLGVEEFLADGIIKIYYSSIGGSSFGTIEVRKMRRTKHKHGIFDLILNEKGIRISKETAVMK